MTISKLYSYEKKQQLNKNGESFLKLNFIRGKNGQN